MKKGILMSLVLVVIFFSVAYAADCAGAASEQGAWSIVAASFVTGLVAVLKALWPVLNDKLGAAVDAYVEHLKAEAERKRAEAKTMENQRVAGRWYDFLNIVDVTAEGAFRASGKLKFGVKDGKPCIENQDEVMAEMKEKVAKQATNSTTDLLKGLGSDIEAVVEARVAAVWGRLLQRNTAGSGTGDTQTAGAAN